MAQEHSVFTWNPVDARWVHERGPEVATPPTPPDVHAIQTYFFDPDGKEWIATVLAPRGRELAAQWQGAYKIPDRVAARSTSGKKSSPAPLFAVVLVLLIVGGGAAAVVAGTQSTPSASVAPTAAPGVSANPVAPVAVSAEPSATAAGATLAPTQAPGGTPVPTQAPVPTPVRTPVRTPVSTVAPPVGTSITLGDGSVVTYSGPARVNIGVPFTVTFTVRNANKTPGSGTFLVSFGNASTGGSKTSSGTLDPSGRITMTMPSAALPGNYPFVVNYKGQQGQVAILRVG
ncbi:MAG TPA: hypothetical protein VFQ66_05550 [Candidatus Limnocylindria bacterium]|nr:hypothetical protein [Candidatus Limnocylindria bacterium]